MLTRREYRKQQKDVHTLCQAVEFEDRKKNRICGKPAIWETVQYAQLGVCAEHKKRGETEGLTLDEGACWLGLSPSPAHYRKRTP